MQPKIHKVNSTLQTILCTSLLLHLTLSSRHIVNIQEGRANFENKCNTKALSMILPDVKFGENLQAFETNTDVQRICSNLKYSCCKANELKYLLHNMKKVFHYINFRNELVEKLIGRVIDMREETFEYFLKYFDDDDIKCYDTIQNSVYNRKLEKFKDNKKVTDMLKQKASEFEFNKQEMREQFSLLQESAINQIKMIRETNANRNKFYSGFVCSMCSPVFNKYFSVEDNTPLMEVNKFMCKSLTNDKLLVLKSVSFYIMMQKVIDMIYCKRVNSKSRHKSKVPAWDNFNISVVDIETVPKLIGFRQNCVDDELAYIKEKNNKDSCKDDCEYTFSLFEIRVIGMEKYILLENELHEQFFKSPASLQTREERYDEIISMYYNEQQKLKDIGLLTVNTNKFVEFISLFSPTEDKQFDFLDTKLTVNLHTGLNVFHTSPNFEVLSALILNCLYLLPLFFLFNIKF